MAENSSFAAGEVFGFSYALFVGVMRGKFEDHVAGGKLEAVDTGSASISDKLHAAADLPEAVPYVFGEDDHLFSWPIHCSSVTVTSDLPSRGSPNPLRPLPLS